MLPSCHRRILVILSLALMVVASCSPAAKLLVEGGEKQVRDQPRLLKPGPFVLIFALDGAGYNQLMEALNSGKAPNMSALLGKDMGSGIYEHAYSVPNVISILPSTTIAAWSSIFTGKGPAYTGVTGNEWFVREQMKFYAPAPDSIDETDDVTKMIAEDLVGNSVRAATLFELAKVKSAVSLNPVYRGADIFTALPTASMLSVATSFMTGNMEESSEKRNIYQQLDRDSVPRLIDSINTHGIANLQVVYFPGIDLYTHLAHDPLNMEVAYLEQVTDPLIGDVLKEYQEKGVLDNTFVVFIADHGHTPVLHDLNHALGTQPNNEPAEVVKAAGFRLRPFVLEAAPDEQDYQAAFAYQGAMAYVYLADRSTCPNEGDRCNWSQPPRFDQDVLPVVRAFYKANRVGRADGQLRGSIDLIFARRPTPPGKDTLPFQIYDGKKLLPIPAYLEEHPRPDLIDLDQRMRWLAVGPYGNRAGDVLVLSKSGLERPIYQRYYFSGPYHSWHGSASIQDSHVPLIVARHNFSGAKLQEIVHRAAPGPVPSHLDFVPIVRALLAEPPGAVAPPPVNVATLPSETPAAKSQ